MKIKIYVLSTVLADENGPAMPAVFADEAEARAKYDEVPRHRLLRRDRQDRQIQRWAHVLPW